MSGSGVIGSIAVTGSHVLMNPRELRRLPGWLRDRKAGALELRRPWWPYEMVDLVEQLLPQRSKVFEYGGGGSSLWLCDHGADLTVVEHHLGWIGKLRELLPTDVELIEAPPRKAGEIVSSHGDGFYDDYVAAIDRYADNVFDLVIVDGRARVDCVDHARSKVAPGGYLLLDDSHRSRYEPVHRTLTEWHATSVTGLKIGSGRPGTTTIWKKPGPVA